MMTNIGGGLLRILITMRMMRGTESSLRPAGANARAIRSRGKGNDWAGVSVMRRQGTRIWGLKAYADGDRIDWSSVAVT